jgi:hypothetical protein
MIFKYSPTNRPKPTLKFTVEDNVNLPGASVHAYQHSQTVTPHPIDKKQDFLSNSTQISEIKHVYDQLPTTASVTDPIIDTVPEIDGKLKGITLPLNPRPAMVTNTKKIKKTTYSTADAVSKFKAKSVSKVINTSPKVIRSKHSFNSAVLKTSDGQLVWDHQEHHAIHLYNLRYGIVPSRDIYNLASPELVVKAGYWDHRVNKKNIANIYINKFNEEIGFYHKLQSSIEKEGIRNPIIVTSGIPRWRSLDEVDPQYRESMRSDQWLFCEFLGGSRLYIAQKNCWLVPVIISDWTGSYSHFKQIKTVDELKSCFMDPPNHIYFTARGLRTTPPPHVHLDKEHQDPRLLSEIRRSIISKDLKNV